jgi:hypothetical protein
VVWRSASSTLLVSERSALLPPSISHPCIIPLEIVYFFSDKWLLGPNPVFIEGGKVYFKRLAVGEPFLFVSQTVKSFVLGPVRRFIIKACISFTNFVIVHMRLTSSTCTIFEYVCIPQNLLRLNVRRQFPVKFVAYGKYFYEHPRASKPISQFPYLVVTSIYMLKISILRRILSAEPSSTVNNIESIRFYGQLYPRPVKIYGLLSTVFLYLEYVAGSIWITVPIIRVRDSATLNMYHMRTRDAAVVNLRTR